MDFLDIHNRDIKELREDIRDLREDIQLLRDSLQKLNEKFSTRLPIWATIYIGALLATIGWLIK